MLSRLRRPPLPRSRGRRAAFIAGVALGFIVPASVSAIFIINAFADIGGNPFAPDINAIAGAGITTGCGGGTYPNGNFCPGDNITRQAEAAFVHRGLPRVAMSSTNLASSISLNSYTAVAQTAITVGGSAAYESDAHQFVKVDGDVTLTFSTAGTTRDWVACLVDTANSSTQLGCQYASENSTAGQSSVHTTWVFSAAPGVHTYQLQVAASNDGGGTANTFNPVIIAETIPFGGTGTNVLAPQAPSKAPSNGATP